MKFTLSKICMCSALSLLAVSAFPCTSPIEEPLHTGSKNELTYTGPFSLKLGARVDYQREYQQSDFVSENSGFKGNNVILSMQGNISNRFAYRFRQRIHQVKHTDNFFDGTDFMYLKYQLNRTLNITAGKVAIQLGSAEYQRDPSQQYFLSEYLNYMQLYKFGIDFGLKLSKHDQLVFQVAESSFRTKDNDLYSLSCSWYGTHGIYHPIYAFNAMEHRRGKFMYALSTGHQLLFSNQLRLNVDFMNRFTTADHFLKDITLRGELMMRPNQHLNLIAIACYDKNEVNDFGPLYTALGTEISRFGAVVEYAPIPTIDRSLIVHAAYNYAYGRRGVKGEVPSMNRHFFTVGVQWEMDIIQLAKTIWQKS